MAAAPVPEPKAGGEIKPGNQRGDANLSKADLRQAVGLTQAQVNSAYCDEFTKPAPPLKPSGKKDPLRMTDFYPSSCLGTKFPAKLCGATICSEK